MTRKTKNPEQEAIEKRLEEKRGCRAPGCRCEDKPGDNPDCRAHDAHEPEPRQAEDGFEVVFDEVEVEAPAAPCCLDCGGPEGGGNCTRCSFKEPPAGWPNLCRHPGCNAKATEPRPGGTDVELCADHYLECLEAETAPAPKGKRNK